MGFSTGFAGCAIGALGVLGLACSASGSFLFFQVSNNGNTPVQQQFLLDVVDRSDLGSGVVGLKVSNVGPLASTIAEFHIEDTTGLFSGYFGGSADGSPAYGTGTGIDFGPPPPGNANLPDKPSPWTTTFFATADASPAVNGVDPGESFELRLVLDGGNTLQDVDDAFSAAQARAGIHVISIEGIGGSETFVTNGQIPAPGGTALAGLAGLLVSRRRRRGH